jgi:hypothetical protein
LSYGFKIARVDDITDESIETEWYGELFFYIWYEYLDLVRHFWSSLDELSELSDDLWDDINKKKYNDHYEYDIEYAHDDIGTIVSECEFCRFVSFFMHSPSMDDSWYPGSWLEKKVREEKSDKK